MDSEFIEVVRRKIMCDPTLYKIWFHSIGNNNKKRYLPLSTDQFFVDGYPRSGNTFTKGLINWVNPSLIGNYHFHTLAPLKMALDYKIKVLILFRDPVECVSSLVLMSDSKFIGNEKELSKRVNRRLKDYIEYYQFVYSRLEKIHLLPFDVIITEQICYALTSFFNVNFSKSELIDFKKINQDAQLGKPSQFSMLPNKYKEVMKNKVKKLIYESPYFNDLGIYELLRSELDEGLSN